MHYSLVASGDLNGCEVAWVAGDELNEGPVHTLHVLLLHDAVQGLQPTTNGLRGQKERMEQRGRGEREEVGHHTLTTSARVR